MIPKGNQRGGAKQLATHLLNAEQNERVQIQSIRGAVAHDLHGAFSEWSAIASGTSCKKHLYSLSINPDKTQGNLTRKQYLDYIKRTEKALALTGQPRAVVFHVKHDREHCHVVWSRIDIEKMKAIQMSYDRQKLREVTREFAREHNLTLPPGMRENRGKDRFRDKNQWATLSEKQQEERTGISKQERQAQITHAWNNSKSGDNLVSALSKRGYYLACGDKKAFVVVDRCGEIHSLPRQIKGVRKKDIDQKLQGYPLDKLPSVQQARQLIAKWNAPKIKAYFNEQTQSRRMTLLEQQQKRRRTLDARKQALITRHHEEMKKLRDFHREEKKAVNTGRKLKRPSGILEFLSKITGIKALAKHRQRTQDKKQQTLHKNDTTALNRRHQRALKEIDRKYKALALVEKRENRSLETDLKREFHTQQRHQPRVSSERRTPALTPQFADRSNPEKTKEKTPLSKKFTEALKDRPAPKHPEKQQDKSRDDGYSR